MALSVQPYTTPTIAAPTYNYPSSPTGGYTGGTNSLTNTANYMTPAIPAPAETLSLLDPSGNPISGAAAGPTAQALSDYNSQRNSTMGSINSGITDTANNYRSGILDYLDARKGQQANINSQSTQNELARQEGSRSILDMVGNGIKSGGVVLANGNSGSSSAGEALARAYGVLGRQQASSVGNQFAQGQTKIGASQTALNAGDDTQIRHSKDKTGTINNIVNSATQALTGLNAAAATANISDRVQIDQEIARIKQQALDALSQYDGELSGGIASQAPQSADASRAAATTMLNAGTAPESMFNYTTDMPAQFQNTGDFASSLPIFTNNKRQTAVA